jgi:type IV pilus assembly protein PilB
VAVTGPTGSGKTTTLYGALRTIATGKVNVMTVEDPIEYEMSGITQMQVQHRQGVTFASALRAILRQDPDVILVGEIRDSETASVSLQAAMTGHLVLATLHTNDASGVVPRLKDLGVDPPAIAAALRGAVAQRLLRRICSDCAEPVEEMTPQEMRLAEAFGVRPLVRASGCECCGYLGYRGRLPILEVLVVSPRVAELIAREAPLPEVERAAREEGMQTLRESAIKRVAEGMVTLTELERVIGDTLEVTPPDSGRARVLIVDDDAVSRRLARVLLEAQNLDVREAADGDEGLRRIAEDGADLVLLDLGMPNVDGREMLARVRANPQSATLPVLVLTGSEDAETEAELMEKGADDYIRKPIDPTRFVARVRAALRRAGR